MNLSGRLIDAFLALEDTRRFALAAQRCNLSGPAFSQMISRLEEQVGLRLFDRDTRKVSLTPEGEVFAQGARRIAAEMQNTLGELANRARLSVGRVSIAAPPSLASHWMPVRMARFKALHPSVALRLSDVPSDRSFELLRARDVDFSINAVPGNPLEFHSRLLFKEDFWLVCRDDHPLAARRSVTLRQLKNQPFIHVVRTSSVWQHLHGLVEAAGVTDTGLQVNHLTTVGGLVGAGFGISVVPRHALTITLQPGIAGVRLTTPSSARSIFAVCRLGHSLSAAAQAFWDFVASDAADDAA